MENHPRVALIGTGSAGRQHITALTGIAADLLVAIPYRESRRVELQQTGIRTARNLSEAVNRWGAIFCIVASDTSMHMPDSLEALSLKLHTLVEKPMCSTASEGRAVYSQARKMHRQLFVGCVLRFSESLAMARSRLRQLGRLHSVRIECQSYLPDWRADRPYGECYSAKAHEGGVLRDLIHEIDYSGWLFGWPSTVQARLTNTGRLGIEAEETADLLWEAPGGVMIAVRLDYLTKPPRRMMTVYGEHGTLEWNAIRNSVRLDLRGQGSDELFSSQGKEEMFSAQLVAFLQTASGKTDERLASGLDGVRALAVCDAARAASQTRREEKVEYL